jgi:DNA-binding MurR/RpiR family transcriptional regulator
MSKISLDETQSILMEEDLKKAIDLLAKVKTCSIFGLGASQVVAMNAFHCFLRSSLNCTYIQDYHLQMMSLTKLGEEDCLFLISHTGHNKDMIQLATIAREKNIPIITITSNRHSPLAKLSDIILVSVSDETKYRPEAVSSLLAQIALVDALFMIYAIKVDDNEEYLLLIKHDFHQRMINNLKKLNKRSFERMCAQSFFFYGYTFFVKNSKSNGAITVLNRIMITNGE